MGIEEIYDKCTEPKETNGQIGSLFKRWIAKGVLGVPIYCNVNKFMSNSGNAILNTSNAEMENLARQYLGYCHEKGLDFVARFNDKYIIGEAKFLTDFGGIKMVNLQML